MKVKEMEVVSEAKRARGMKKRVKEIDRERGGRGREMK